MSQYIRLFASAIITFALLLTLTGCSTPDTDWDWGTEVSDVPPAYGTPDGDIGAPADPAYTADQTDAENPFEFVPPEQAGDWSSTQDTLPPIDQGFTPVNEKRWEGLVVYFAYDRSSIGTSERAKLEHLADYLKAYPEYYVVVEGHCDERGSSEYNRNLGERRALAIKEYMVALGINENRIQTTSYGEEKPAVMDATTERDHAKNRRAEFVIGVNRK